MINGAHAIVYSKNAEADRRFLRDVLGLSHVDAGDGWLIFGLPPSEVAVHPSENNDLHELYLMCDDVEAFIRQMEQRGIVCSPARDLGWGVLTEVTLPGGGELGVYQPRHPRPPTVGRRGRAKPKRRPAPSKRKSAKKRATKRSVARTRKSSRRRGR